MKGIQCKLFLDWRRFNAYSWRRITRMDLNSINSLVRCALSNTVRIWQIRSLLFINGINLSDAGSINSARSVNKLRNNARDTKNWQIQKNRWWCPNHREMISSIGWTAPTYHSQYRWQMQFNYASFLSSTDKNWWPKRGISWRKSQTTLVIQNRKQNHIVNVVGLSLSSAVGV